MRLLLLGMLFLASAAHAGDDWTREDTYRQTALTALLIADWAQTRYIAKHPDEFREESFALIGHPSVGRVNTYMAGLIIGHAAISYVLDPEWRRSWQYLWIGAEFNQVRRNVSAGVKLQF